MASALKKRKISDESYDDVPVVNVNDVVEVEWPMDDGTYQPLIAVITKIKKAKKIKSNSLYKYSLKVLNNEEILTTRLLHLNWKLHKDQNKNNKVKDTKQNTTNLPIHKFILAPMVGGSELAFRLLCRKYGSNLCYTPMLHSKMMITNKTYKDEHFTTCK